MRSRRTGTEVPPQDVVIGDAVRSPLGSLRGGSTLTGIPPAVLLAQAASALLERTLLETGAVTKVLIAGGQHCDPIALDACSLIGLETDAVSSCGSGDTRRSPIHRAANAIGRRDVVLVLGTSGLAGRPPLPSRRRISDAELVASRWNLDRRELDAYARMSRQRAREVAAMGEFAPEIVPAVAWSDDSCAVVTADETLAEDAVPDGVRPRDEHRYLHPGTISRPAAGAAATVLLGHNRAMELGIRPRARIVALAESEDDPYSRGCGAIRASSELLAGHGIDPDDLDHYEVSEAAAPVPVAWRREFDADVDRFNPRGGSLALGSLGPASSLRSLATMLSALHATGGRLAIHASEDRPGAGEALLIEYLHRPCCSREALGGPYCTDVDSAHRARTGRTGVPATGNHS